MAYIPPELANMAGNSSSSITTSTTKKKKKRIFVPTSKVKEAREAIKVRNLNGGKGTRVELERETERKLQNAQSRQKVIDRNSEQMKVPRVMYGKVVKDPYEKSKTQYSAVKNVGGVPVGLDLIPQYKEDDPVTKVGKGIVNYAGGTVLRTQGAVQQGMMQGARAIDNAIRGKPQDFSDMEFVRDFAPGIDKGLNNLASKGKLGEFVSGFARTAIESLTDPTTFVMGGAVDDLTKAGRWGKAGTLGTTENMVHTAERNAKAANLPFKSGVTRAAAETPIPETPKPTTVIPETPTPKKPTIDDLIKKQQDVVDDLRYQRNELGADTTGEIEKAEEQLTNLKREKYLPYYKEQLDNLEKRQLELNKPDDIAELADVSDRVNKLKSQIADIESKRTLVDEVPDSAKAASEEVPGSTVQQTPVQTATGTPVDTNTKGVDVDVNQEKLRSMEETVRENLKRANTPVGDSPLYSASTSTRPDIQIAKSIAKTLGVDIQIIKPNSEEANYFNGLYHNGTIFISEAADNPAHVVLGHEVVEQLAKSNPEAFQEFISVFKRELSKKKSAAYHAKLTAAAERVGKTLDDDAFIKEAAGDFSGELFNNPKIMKKLMAQSPSVAKDVIDIVHDLITKLKYAVNPDYRVKKFLKDAKRVEDSYMGMMEKFTNDNIKSNLKESLNNPTPKVSGTEPQYSLKLNSGMYINAAKKNALTGAVDEPILTKAQEDMDRVAAFLNDPKVKAVMPEDEVGDVVSGNSDYGKSIENSKICNRSMVVSDLVYKVSKKLGHFLTNDEQFAISQGLLNYTGKTSECLYCYVAATRRAFNEAFGNWFKDRAAVWDMLNKGEAPDVAYTKYLNGRKDTSMTRARFKMWMNNRSSDLTIDDVFKAKLVTNKKEIKGLGASEFYKNEQLRDIYRYAYSASRSPKSIVYQAYDGSILSFKVELIKRLNSNEGLRFYSFSDFSPAFILENMQEMRDASIMNLSGLAYTKEADFVHIFAPTKANINMSIAAFEQNGKIAEETMMGMEWKEVQDLAERYPNAAPMFMATSDNQVVFGMKEPWIRQVIPFHLSHMKSIHAEELGYTNFTYGQTEMFNGKAVHIFPEEHMNDYDTYMAIVKNKGYKEKFPQFHALAEERMKAEPSETEMWKDGYMKLVKEAAARKPLAPTPTMQPVYNTDYALKVLNKFVEDSDKTFGGYYKQAPDQIVDDMAAMLQGEKVGFGTMDDLAKKFKKPVKPEYSILSEPPKKPDGIDYSLKRKTSEYRTNTLERTLPDDLKDKIDKHEFDFIPETSAKWQKDAETNIANDRNKVIQDIANSTAISGGTQAHEAAIIYSELVQKAEQTKSPSDVKALLDWVKVVAEKTRSAAQGLAGTGTAYERHSIEGKLMEAQRAVDEQERSLAKSNPRLMKRVNKETQKLIKNFEDLGNTVDPDAIRDFVKRKFGISTLDNKDVQGIINYMQKAKTMPTGSYDQRRLWGLTQNIIDRKKKRTAVDKTRAVRNMALLTNAHTVAINNISNAMLGVASNVSNVVGATVVKPLDNLMSTQTGYKTVAMPSALKQGKGFATGIAEQFKDSLGGLQLNDLKGKTPIEKVKILLDHIANPIDTNMIGMEKFEGSNGLAFKSNFWRTLENLQRTVITDRPFEQAYFDDILNQLKKANKVKEATQEMIDTAKKVASERTLRDANTISTFINFLKNSPTYALGKIAPEEAKLIQVFFDTLLPYAKTPSNLLKRGIEYTPAGFIEGMVKLAYNWKKGKLNMMKQREIIDRISSSIVGSGIMGAGAGLTAYGLARGKSDKDKDVAKFEQSLGRNENSVKVGDKYYTYGNLEPLSAPFGIGVQSAEGKLQSNDVITLVVTAVSNALQYFNDQAMLQGVQQVLGSGNGNDKEVGERIVSAALELPKQFIPTVLKQIRIKSDPLERETYSDSYLERNLINPMKDKIPYNIFGLPISSKTLPAKVNSQGEEVKQYQGDNNWLNILINPTKTTTFNPNPVQQEILRIYDESGIKNQMPTMVEKYIDKTLDHPKITLTAKEYTQYQRLTGQLTMQTFQKIMNSDRYKNAKTSKSGTADEKRAKMLAEAISEAKAKAKLQILKSRGYSR